MAIESNIGCLLVSFQFMLAWFQDAMVVFPGIRLLPQQCSLSSGCASFRRKSLECMELL